MDADYFKKLQAVPPFAAAATALQTGDLFSDLTGAVTAPVLYSYVWWCLQQAIHDQVDTLYFLARDGHILYEIAKRFCEQYALPIHCQYLYVSRMALRMPAYHRMGEAAYDLLLVRGANLTPRHVLERLALSAEEQQQVYADCAIPAEDCDKSLSVQAFTALAEQLRKSSVYRNLYRKITGSRNRCYGLSGTGRLAARCPDRHCRQRLEWLDAELPDDVVGEGSRKTIAQPERLLFRVVY